MTMHIDKYIEKLVTVCRERGTLNQKHAAMVVNTRTGQIISLGFNYTTYSPITKKWFTTHAEVDAMSKIKFKLNNPKMTRTLILIVIRCNNGKTPINSMPCVDCQDRIRKKGIKTVFHS